MLIQFSIYIAYSTGSAALLNINIIISGSSLESRVIEHLPPLFLLVVKALIHIVELFSVEYLGVKASPSWWR